ncbi:MAG: hypothetical protein IJR49_02655 [Treponema sp.]|nr:hypothetical protein [Treponema sp.]
MLCVTPLFSSCTHRENFVSLSMPDWPKDFPPLSHWVVQYRIGNTAKTFRVRGENCVLIPTTKSIPCAVVAQPVCILGGKEYEFFKVAGCVYPASKVLSWEDGFTASVCLQIYNSSLESGELQFSEYLAEKNHAKNSQTGVYLSKFNWQKFSETLRKKQNESPIPYDPWLCDITAICKGIANHSFNANLLSMKNYTTISCSAVLEKAPLATYFFSQYIPLNKSTNDVFTVRKDGVTKYLCSEENILYISIKNSTLEISPLPLYTGDT